MKIKKLHIKNFKSLVDLEIVEPNPFTVFVGANGVGKSNIFEALEFGLWPNSSNKLRVFGYAENLQNKRFESEVYQFEIKSDKFDFDTEGKYYRSDQFDDEGSLDFFNNRGEFQVFSNSFSRYFIGKVDYQKINFTDSFKLNFSSSNLEKVLKRLLGDKNKQQEIFDFLQLLIPEFQRLEIHSDNIGGQETLLIYERGFSQPFTRNLLSDGTYNILCLLTAVYQSDEPQFLCIEEPENGLTPDVIKELVKLFRNACEEKGHYIWLNTHSQSLVSQLTADELITVDKVNGETRIKQFKGKDFHGLSMDEAWLTNTLGAGLPW